ncbi:hypothetical protein NPIL_20861 [Nephila pilipes]|uniref:Uncharacterized protein n=1 Tax=Nephila pilipes TaxID=299642 RepID=A0A8X6PAE5_NEPPI|nr:hypothetical protein NPIL_20861 [Nephila pilipes]
MTAWDQRKIAPSHAKAVEAISYVNEPRDSEEGVELLMPNRWSCESKKELSQTESGSYEKRVCGRGAMRGEGKKMTAHSYAIKSGDKKNS